MEARHTLATRAFWFVFVITVLFVLATLDGCKATQADAQMVAPPNSVEVRGENTLSLSIGDVVKWLFLTLTALCVYIVKGMQSTQRELVSMVQGHNTRITVIETLCERHTGERGKHE